MQTNKMAVYNAASLPGVLTGQMPYWPTRAARECSCPHAALWQSSHQMALWWSSATSAREVRRPRVRLPACRAACPPGVSSLHYDASPLPLSDTMRVCETQTDSTRGQEVMWTESVTQSHQLAHISSVWLRYTTRTTCQKPEVFMFTNHQSKHSYTIQN